MARIDRRAVDFGMNQRQRALGRLRPVARPAPRRHAQHLRPARRRYGPRPGTPCPARPWTGRWAAAGPRVPAHERTRVPRERRSPSGGRRVARGSGGFFEARAHIVRRPRGASRLFPPRVRRAALAGRPLLRRYCGLCQFLPGPASSQVGISLGLVRAGYAGAFAAWLGFTLPSAALMVAFGYGASARERRALAGCMDCRSSPSPWWRRP